MFFFCSKDEQKQNPDAAINALKLFNYSLKKPAQNVPFKPFITQDTINEEMEEINHILGMCLLFFCCVLHIGTWLTSHPHCAYLCCQKNMFSTLIKVLH